MNISIRNVPMTGLSLALALVLALPSVMRAQNAPPPPPAQNAPSPMMNGAPMRGQMQGRRMGPEMQLKHMTRMLDLSTAQQQAILPILQDRDHQIQSLRKDQTVPRAVRRQQMRSIVETTQKRIKAVLNGTQIKQYDEMMANNRKHMQEHMQMRMQQNNMQPPNGAPQGPPANRGGQGPQ